VKKIEYRAALQEVESLIARTQKRAKGRGGVRAIHLEERGEKLRVRDRKDLRRFNST